MSGEEEGLILNAIGQPPHTVRTPDGIMVGTVDAGNGKQIPIVLQPVAEMPSEKMAREDREEREKKDRQKTTPPAP